jgi:polysaccharide biosynthesis transport protein
MAINREDEVPAAGPPPSLPVSVPHGYPLASNLDGERPLLEQAPASPPGSNGGLLLRALRRRWRLALTVGFVLGCVGAAVVWILRPAKFSTYALVRIDPQRPTVLPKDHAVNDLDLYRMTQAALLKSPKVLDAAVRSERVRELPIVTQEADPVAWLETMLVVEPIRNTELLRVSLSGQDAEQIVLVVNAVIDAYLQEVVNKDQKQRLDHLKDLKDVCEKSEEKLRQQRKNLQAVAESLKASDPETALQRQQVAREEYLALRKELITIGSELRQATRNREGDPHSASGQLPVAMGVALEQALDENLEVQAEAKKVAQAEEFLAKIKAKALPGFSGITDAETAVQSAKDAMNTLRARLRRGMEEKVRQRTEADAKEAAAKRAEREALIKDQFDAVLKEVEERRKTADQIGLTVLLFETERSEIEQADKIIKSLWAERERLEAEGRSKVQRVTVEVEAMAPRKPNHKSQLLAVGVAGGVFFLVGVFGVAFLDSRSRRIYSREEVVHGLRLRVLGTLPVMMDPPSHPTRGQLKYACWGHQWTEALNGLRTVVLHEAGQHSLQVVMVASAAPQEGKSILAGQLAVSLAGAGRRTLLIDADLRRPVLHNVLTARLAPGLSEALREECGLAAAIQQTSTPGLDFLSAGLFTEPVVDLLAQGRLELLLQPLRSQYDAIVIDSSPIMAVNDALLIGHHVDAVLLSVRPSRSQAPMVTETCERLRALAIPVLGTVLNGLASSPRDVHYQYVSNAPDHPGTAAREKARRPRLGNK